MKKSLVMLLLATGFVAGCVTDQPEPSPMIPLGEMPGLPCSQDNPINGFSLDHYKNVEGTLRTFFHMGRYDLLDQSISCLMKTDVRFVSGHDAAVAVYWLYRSELGAQGITAPVVKAVREWNEHAPDSLYARFASIRMLYAEGWRARGASYGHLVPEDRWEIFRSKLSEAEQALLTAPDELRETPIAYNLLLAITLDASSSTESDAEEVFARAVEKWPYYYDFLDVMLSRLTPNWGGSWEEVDVFIRHWAEERKHAEGSSLYARLYYGLHSMAGAEPGLTLMDWPTMKTSLDDLVERYPSSYHLNIAASYACLMGDREYYDRYMGWIAEGQAERPGVWLPMAPMEACKYAVEQMDR